MADGEGLCEAATAAASPAAPAPGLSPPLGWRERLRAGLAGTGASLWFVAGLGLLYALKVPLRLCENLAAGEARISPGPGAGPGEVPGASAKGQRCSSRCRASENESGARPSGFFFSWAAAPQLTQTWAAAAGSSPELVTSSLSPVLVCPGKSHLTRCKLRVVGQMSAFADL